nr:hypothetical protein [Rhizobium phaseoli]
MGIGKCFGRRDQNVAPHSIELAVRLLEKKTEFDHRLVVLESASDGRHPMKADLPGGVQNPLRRLRTHGIATVQHAVDC